jgi:2-polyprenyl-3-methyl-5-hydroxy-6-metoxy-1,4-benzoquinol methylase
MSEKNKPAKKPAKPAATTRELNPITLRAAMTRRVQRRTACSGRISVPAVPGMLEHYVAMCAGLFKAVGREFSEQELDHARKILSEKLTEAFETSHRSSIIITYEAAIGALLNYKIAASVTTVEDEYAHWLTNRKPPLFGAHPDRRLVALTAELGEPASSPVLDVGAGTGRNALALARMGFPVDAVEMTGALAQILEDDAAKQGLPVRVIRRSLFEAAQELDRAYRLVLLSEVVSDFRHTAQLRKMFELAASALAPGGYLLFNAFLAADGYTPERVVRDFAQLSYAVIFTRAEVAAAVEGLPLEKIGEDSVHQYEKEHTPEGEWPPTGWYEDWVSGRDVFDLERGRCPADMRWLIYRKTETESAGA